MAYSNNTGLPSVSDILRPFINTAYFTEEHSARGSAVHSACNAHINGAYVPPLEPGHQPYFDSFRRWADASVDVVLYSEERLVDESMHYCGQFDIVAALKGDRGFSVIDLKTSQSFYDWFPVQLAGYAHLIVKAKEMAITRRLSVLLKNDGSGCKTKDYAGETHWNVFRSALNCYKYFNKNGG